MIEGSDVRSFQITLDGLTTFRNDSGTRSFVSVLVKEGKQAVCDLVTAVDRAFAFLGLQTFYKARLLSPRKDRLKKFCAILRCAFALTLRHHTMQPCRIRSLMCRSAGPWATALTLCSMPLKRSASVRRNKARRSEALRGSTRCAWSLLCPVGLVAD